MENTSWASSDGVRRSMRSNRGRDTKPELRVRRLVHAKGMRYRVNARPIPGLRRTADLLFSKARVIVLIDGCFWHGCSIHYTPPKTNSEFWVSKIQQNRARDAETVALLEAADWTVLRFWEHSDPVDIADAIEEAVIPARSATPKGKTKPTRYDGTT
ncbi:very short patch repair endonuclease [Citricoccus nitrophenolicus]